MLAMRNLTFEPKDTTPLAHCLRCSFARRCLTFFTYFCPLLRALAAKTGSKTLHIPLSHNESEVAEKHKMKVCSQGFVAEMLISYLAMSAPCEARFKTALRACNILGAACCNFCCSKACRLSHEVAAATLQTATLELDLHVRNGIQIWHVRSKTF